MEGHVWRMIERLLLSVEGKARRCTYSDREILLVSLWAILHDRPMVWACQAENWSEAFRPPRLPDPSTLSRRWQQTSLRNKAYALHKYSVETLGVPCRYAAIDGRPLPVGGCSKDPDARSGRSAGGWGKGYKMHALVDFRHVILSYAIRPMNQAEQTVAVHLLEEAPAIVTRVVGDGVYDSMRLHATAAAHGRKLYTPLRENRVGKRKQPRRVHLLRLGNRAVGRRLLESRNEIERTFGQSSTICFGFKGLPAWARRSQRVFRWIWGKNFSYHAWLLTKQPAA